MDQSEAFLARISSDPFDLETLSIYADWLDEQSDPRGVLVRQLATIRAADAQTLAAESVRESLIDAAAEADSAWLQRLGVYFRNEDYSEFKDRLESLHQTQRFVLLRFWAEWCGPCRKYTSVIKEIAFDFAGLGVVLDVNMDEEVSFAQEMNIVSIPATVIYVKGKQVSAHTGHQVRSQFRSVLLDAIAT